MCTWEAVLNIIESLGIIIASGVAVWGVSSWRRELVGRRRYELAEEVLSLAYEVRDRLSAIRSPFSAADEGRTRRRSEGETEEESRRLDSAYIAVERYYAEATRRPFERLQVLRYAFMATFGPEAAQPLFDLQKIVNQVITAAQMLAILRSQPALTMQQAEAQSPLLREQEGLIWQLSEANDPIIPRVDAAITALERVCRPVLEAASPKTAA